MNKKIELNTVKKLKLVECPRDAMQGIVPFIPTAKKAKYINTLLKVGFDTIDFGSFVSPKAIPQLKDTAEVLAQLDMSQTTTKLLAVIGNVRGAITGVQYPEISYFGFPHSVSETFLQRNLNSSIEKSNTAIKEILEVCDKNKKELVVYISMGFGNPYNDDFNVEIVCEQVEQLYQMGVRIIPLSDTIGCSTPQIIAELYATLVPRYPDVEFAFHLHTSVVHWYGKVDAAYKNGCRRFDTVINGLGGCPNALVGQLVGNLRTSNMLEYLETIGVETNINEEAFLQSYMQALRTFQTAKLAK